MEDCCSDGRARERGATIVHTNVQPPLRCDNKYIRNRPQGPHTLCSFVSFSLFSFFLYRFFICLSACLFWISFSLCEYWEKKKVLACARPIFQSILWRYNFCFFFFLSSSFSSPFSLAVILLSTSRPFGAETEAPYSSSQTLQQAFSFLPLLLKPSFSLKWSQ